jgi:hypothetical protein
MKSSASAAVVVSFLATGCGGGAGSNINVGTCGVAPCGGDVVGDWAASSVCIDPTPFSMDILRRVKSTCPDLSLGTVTITPSGTLSLAADRSFTGSLVVNAAVALIYPATCVAGASCDDLTATLRTTVGTNGITGVSCVGTDSCTCTTTQAIDIVNATGTWATSGTQLTFAGAPGGNGPYCVQGSSLHLIGLDTTTMSEVVNDIVLIKQ